MRFMDHTASASTQDVPPRRDVSTSVLLFALLCFALLCFALLCFDLLSRNSLNLGINLGAAQAFLSLVLPDLEQSGPRVRDPAKEKEVRLAAEKAIKEIRSYGFEVIILDLL